MLYGLNKIANAIIKGVPIDSSYFFVCDNFEMLVEKLYASESTMPETTVTTKSI